MMILKAFNHWYSESTADTQSFLDYHIQLRAFAIIIRNAIPFPQGVSIIVKCYKLDQLDDPQDCIVLVRQLLDKKDFYKVQCIGLLLQYSTVPQNYW